MPSQAPDPQKIMAYVFLPDYCDSTIQDCSFAAENVSDYVLYSRQKSRTPLVIATAVGATALFVGLKWKAVFARSENAKDVAKDIDYHVKPGVRSGMSRPMGGYWRTRTRADFWKQEVVSSCYEGLGVTIIRTMTNLRTKKCDMSLSERHEVCQT